MILGSADLNHEVLTREKIFVILLIKSVQFPNILATSCITLIISKRAVLLSLV